MDFNYYDIAIIVILLITALIGFMRGIVWMGIFLATWTAAILLAIKYKDQLAAVLPIKLSSDVAQMGLAALLIFLGVLVLGAILNYTFGKIIAAVGLGAFDRILGTGLGIVLGALAISLLTILLKNTELPDSDIWQKSQFIPKFEEIADWLQTLIPEDLNQYIDTNSNGNTDIITPSTNIDTTTTPTPNN